MREVKEKLGEKYGCRFPSIYVYQRYLRRRLIREKIGLVYSNTATNGELLEFLSPLKCPFITHVHELEWGINHYGRERFKLVKRYTDRYIAASNAVKDNLLSNFQIADSQVDVNYEFIPSYADEQKLLKISSDRIKAELGIPPNALIVCGSGTTGWRKAPDLFVQLARVVHKKRADLKTYFIWVGGENRGNRFNNIWHDVKKLKLERYFRFVGSQENPFDYFAACQVFAMVSREDPFPLVCLESAALGKPIVCFDNAGGMKEFVQDDAGFVVPYLDVEAMADKIIRLFESAALRRKLGNRARDKVLQHHTVDAVAPAILSIIKSTMDIKFSSGKYPNCSI